LVQKFSAFRWDPIRINGHDHDALSNAFLSQGKKGMPTVLVADTVKGKGVSFMENLLIWHYRNPDANQLAAAVSELTSNDARRT